MDADPLFKLGLLTNAHCVFVNYKPYTGLSQIITDNNYTLWVKLSKEMFGWDQDLYTCTFYIPPQDSPYFQDQFDQLENEIARFRHDGDVLLMGDSNSRTANNGRTLNDFILHDSDTYLPLPDTYISDCPGKPRHSMDQRSNTHGHKLIDLCIASQTRILNGRTSGDCIGKLTCHHHAGSSIVDYFLCNDRILDRVVCVNVQPLLPNSIHCPISCFLKCDFRPTDSSSIKTKPLPAKYKLNEMHIDFPIVR